MEKEERVKPVALVERTHCALLQFRNAFGICSFVRSVLEEFFHRTNWKDFSEEKSSNGKKGEKIVQNEQRQLYTTEIATQWRYALLPPVSVNLSHRSSFLLHPTYCSSFKEIRAARSSFHAIFYNVESISLELTWHYPPTTMQRKFSIPTDLSTSHKEAQKH